MDLLIRHRIPDEARLAAVLEGLTRDPRVLEHIHHLERQPSGLRYRFTGPRVPRGELRATVAAEAKPGVIHIQLELSMMARLFSGAVESTLRTVAAEVLGADLAEARR